jgi:hypothetical protein
MLGTVPVQRFLRLVRDLSCGLPKLEQLLEIRFLELAEEPSKLSDGALRMGFGQGAKREEGAPSLRTRVRLIRKWKS